jgi:hypothetical protein
MSNLVNTLAVSGTLARRWNDVTPKMELEWNPRDEKQTVEAVGEWLRYVSETRFPVIRICQTINEAEMYLSRAPVTAMGSDMMSNDDGYYGYYGYYDLDGLIYLLLILEQMMDFGEMSAGRQVLGELHARFGLKRVAPLSEITYWLREEMGRVASPRRMNQRLLEVLGADEEEGETAVADSKTFPDDVDHWMGFVKYLNYCQQSTPHDILNWSGADDPDDDEANLLQVNWDDDAAVQAMAEQWGKAEGYLDEIREFYTWADASRDNLDYVVEVVRQACEAYRYADNQWTHDWYASANHLLEQEYWEDGDWGEEE